MGIAELTDGFNRVKKQQLPFSLLIIHKEKKTKQKMKMNSELGFHIESEFITREKWHELRSGEFHFKVILMHSYVTGDPSYLKLYYIKFKATFK